MGLCNKSKTTILKLFVFVLLATELGCDTEDQDNMNNQHKLPEPAMDYEFTTEGELPAVVQFILTNPKMQSVKNGNLEMAQLIIQKTLNTVIP
jgi:hypothetical protein